MFQTTNQLWKEKTWNIYSVQCQQQAFGKKNAVHVFFNNLIPGWWYTYPSEKYESQLG